MGSALSLGRFRIVWIGGYIVNSRLMKVLAVSILAILPATKSHAVDGNPSLKFVPSELICAMEQGYNIDSLCARYGVTYLESLGTGYGSYFCYLLSIQPDMSVDSLANIIAAAPGVIDCTPNYVMQAPEPVQRSQPFLDVGGPGDVQAQHALSQLHLWGAHQKSTGLGIKVAVIDVGVDASHPMLSGFVLPGIDYVDDDLDATDEPGGPASGHGTLIAGIIHMVAPDAQIVPYRVIDTLGNGSGFDVALAILAAIEVGCRIINISLVMEATNPAMRYVAQAARSQGVVIVAAAGNDESNVPLYPAADPNCLGVAALDASDVKCSFSNWGAHIDLSAPGEDIKGPFLNDQFARWSGTSFAAPFVAGTGALLLARIPMATWNDVVNVMTGTAKKIDQLNPTFAGSLGAGKIDPLAAINRWAPTAGDVDASGLISSADILMLVAYVFKGGPEPSDINDGDIDGSCEINAADVIYLVQYVFDSGPLPLKGCVVVSGRLSSHSKRSRI